MDKMNSVVHFEMPFEDRERMVGFYEKAFGWKASLLGPEMGDYAVMQTAETDEKMMVKEPGRINGGFFKKSEDNQHPSVVIGVNDIYEAIKKIEACGGKIIGGGHKAGEPDDIPGIGLYISFLDTEGNRVSLIQPNKM